MIGEALNKDVFIQDQHTEIIDLYMSQVIQSISIVTDTALDDSVVTISGAEPVDGNYVCFKEGVAFYQGEILSHVANAVNWDVTLDTPLDFPFTTAGGCSETNINMAVDGSIAPQKFTLEANNLAAGNKWDVTRILFSLTDGTVMDSSKFGGITALTKGVVLRMEGGKTKNVLNVKSNSDFALRMYDVDYIDNAPAGKYGVNCRRSFAGRGQNGVTLRIETDANDSLVIVIQDDLTGLDSFKSIVQGHVVD